MSTLTLERSILVAAPRQRVWEAITQPEQIAQWLMPPALGAQLKSDDSGQLSVLMGPMEVGFALLENSDPPRQVTTRGFPDKVLAVTYTLDEAPGGTRVTVTVAGLDRLPAAAAQERLEPMGQGWDKLLQNLKAFVEGAPLPHPEGYIAASFGFRRQTPKQFAVERSIWLKAPRERVWQAITDPQQIPQWFSPGTEWRASALQVGGTLGVWDPETASEKYVQVIDVFDAPHRLVTRTVDEPVHTTIWVLDEEAGGTRLTLTNTGYENEADDVRHNNNEQNAFGFGLMMVNLQAYVDCRDLPYPMGFLRLSKTF